MRALIHSVLRHRRFLAALTVTLGFLLTPARADAQVWWDDEFSQTFTTFGPNQAVTIANGIGPMARCGGILPVIEIYVVNVSSMADGASITDVSNANGLPNTVFPFSGGFFGGETIAFTAPGGNLGPGTYGIVMKSCRDGVFHAGSDMFMYPAFEVVIDANIPVLADPSIAALKNRAHEQAQKFVDMWAVVNALEWLERANMFRECIHLVMHGGPAGIAHCAAMWAYHAATYALVIRPAHHTTDDAISHYEGIHADPPDPLFQQVTPLEPFERMAEDADRPILNAMFRWSNTMGSEAAILEAMLHSMERYQGAAIGTNPEWALVHARQFQSYAAALRNQLPATNVMLTAMNNAVQSNPADIDTLNTEWAAVHAQLVTTGFGVLEIQALMNSGYSQAQINDLRNQIINDVPPQAGLTKASVQALITAQLAENIDFVSELSALESYMDSVITALLAEPLVTNSHPVADAAGPYSGNEGTALALDGSASTDPGGAITAYAWDIDGDGQFDDAIGATPSVTFPSSFEGFVGLRVSDADGNTSVAYALVSIADVNHAPTISAVTPDSAGVMTTVGSMTAFSVTATDADGDPVSVRWLVGGIEVGTGSTFDYTPASPGQQVLRAQATDNNPLGGTVAHEWAVSVSAADADGDGWASNVDCNDGNPLVHPFGPEIIGNGIDDDCRADTLDGGTPPSAGFSHGPSPALVGQAVSFTDSSVDPDSATLLYSWTFGDGGTSTLQNPTHVYATAGTFSVSLTVTDPQSFTSNASGNVVVTNAPTAAFTFSPNPGIRNSPVAFANTSSDPDGPLASYQWSFGDGGISNEPNPSHTYDTAGTFPVQLTVTDAAGVTAFTAQSITINPAGTDVTSLRFIVNETNCGTGPVYRFTIGGVQVATITPAYDCDCSAALKTVTITDPAILAMVSSPVCQVFGLEASNVYYFSSARVEITRPTGVQRIRIVNNNAADGPDVYTQYACYAWYGNGPVSFQSALPNLDGDAIPDCTDPDVDGDGIDNTGDNCPVNGNPTQADFNSNGVGDACEDSDGDTRIDAADNCQAVANTNQWDFDADGIGNLCDADADGDGVINTADNCTFISNAAQVDTDGNGHGDACDIRELNIKVQKSTEGYVTPLRISLDGILLGTLAPEPGGGYCGQPTKVLTFTDPETLALLGTTPTCNSFRVQGDYYTYISWAKAEMTHHSGAVDTVVIHDVTGGVFQQYACYGFYHAPNFANATPDTDGDGVYNCEDPDMDSDGVLNAADNCPFVPNPGQDDVDSNGVGNACQDTDVDGVLDINDNCPVLANTNQSNIDGDSMGDACDPDRDNDTVLNAADNCADTANTNQSDIDADFIGDVCDPDIDGDTVQNGSDNCPVTVNPNQRNTDGDSVGDACDPDIDNDSVLNAADNCLYVSNTGQESTNPYGVGDSCIVRPITIPWLGVATQPHQVYSGGSLVLQGIAVYDGSYAPADILSAVWDPGDGSPAQSVSLTNPMALELTHTYAGANNTPFTAVLTITMLNGSTRSDEFRVLIQPRTIDVEANMAIDRGLWNLHKSRNNTSHTGAAGPVPTAYWTGSDTIAATSATINAFGVNNHKINGNRLEDPYVEDVRRGLGYLEASLSAFGTSVQPAGNPDTNGNGIALHYGGSVYITGQIADAFVAAAQQTSVAVVGDATWVRGRTHRELVNDIMDAYWFGQSDIGGSNRGGWHYGWNYGSADNSTAQWGAITGLAGENAWNIPVPQWVRDENIIWVRTTQITDPSSSLYGAMTYMPGWCAWSNCMATTPSGMVQMDFDGVRNNPDATSGDELGFQLGVRFMARGMRNGWHTSDPSYGGINYYAMFAMAKAFRLAVDTDSGGNFIADPVVVIDDNPADAVAGFDWYRNDPLTPNSASPMGVARLLINRQNASGNWPDVGYWAGSLATAYSVIILSPTIFEIGPAAMCSAVPSIAGVGDTVTFDGSGSIHNDPFGQIASYTWNFQDGGTATNAAPTSSATHVFNALGTYNVLLTVTDTNGITAAASCPVTIIEGNRPPIANAGGPYHFCAGGPMVLNASGSTDPEGGALTFAWDLSSPLTFSNVDGTTAVFDASSPVFLGSLLPGIYQIGLRVTDDHAHSDSVFPNITIHSADDPDYCNTAPELTLSPSLTTYATSAAGAQVSYTVTAADPQQGNIPPVCTPASNTIFAIGTTTVECTATDAHGLTDTGSFTVTVLNNPPAFTPPDDIERVALTAAGVAVSFTANGTDLEDGDIPASCLPASGSNFPIGSTTVNCTVTDSRGATAGGSFNVIVRPPVNVGPSFTPPANITTSTTNAGGTAVTFTAAGSDPEDGAIAAACVPGSGSNFVIGATTVNCTVTDSGGLFATGSFTVTVDLIVTNHPPVLTLPANMMVLATSASGATVSFTASASDIEDGTIPAVCTPASGSQFPIGSTTIHCTATDSGGLTANGNFAITVTTTNKPPSIIPPKVVVSATSPAGAIVFYQATAIDREDGPVTVSCVPPSGSQFPIGTTWVTCTATDSGGLTATVPFRVVVNPNSRPKLTAPSNITKTATEAGGAVVTYSVTATDVEDGVLPVSCTVPSGALFPIGQTNVTCSATDSYGTTSSVVFRVVINAP